MIEFGIAIAAALYTAWLLIREADEAGTPSQPRAPIVPASAPPAGARPRPATPKRVADPPSGNGASPARAAVLDRPAPHAPAIPTTEAPAPPAQALTETPAEPLTSVASVGTATAQRAPAPEQAFEIVPEKVGAARLVPDPEKLIQTEVALPAGVGRQIFAVVKLLVGVALFGCLLALTLLGFVKGVGVLIQRLAGS